MSNNSCFRCSSALTTTAANAQSVPIDGLIDFDINNVLVGNSIQHTPSSNTTLLVDQGLYLVTFNADVVSQSAGDITIQLLNNGEPVVGAQATITAASGDTYQVSFTTILKVLKSCPCIIDNKASLQVQVSVATTITNSNLAVAKFA